MNTSIWKSQSIKESKITSIFRWKEQDIRAGIVLISCATLIDKSRQKADILWRHTYYSSSKWIEKYICRVVVNFLSLREKQEIVEEVLDPCLELDSRSWKAISECVFLANYVIEAVVLLKKSLLEFIENPPGRGRTKPAANFPSSKCLSCSFASTPTSQKWLSRSLFTFSF